jgi:proline iminopeptidase
MNADESIQIEYADLGPVQEKLVSVENAKLFCRVMGQGEPLIVLHGGPGLSQDYLLPQLYKLAENNLIIFYDQRGCGQSTGEINANTINIETFVSDLDTLRKAFNFQKFSILGHSWGGFLAMQYVIANPENVDKLILANSIPASSEDFTLFGQEWMLRMAPHLKELEAIHQTKEFAEGNSEIMEKMYRMIFRTYCCNPEKANLLNLSLPPSASINGSKVYEIFRETVLDKSFNLYDSLHTLKIPTLVIHGDADPISPMTAQKIHESIKDSHYILMKDCGHFPYVEDPNAYFKHLKDFLMEDISMQFTILPFESKYQSQVIDLIERIQVGEFHIPIEEGQRKELQSISQSFQKNKGNYWVALFNGKVIGTIAVIDIGHNAFELRDVFLDKEYRGQKTGFAKKLLDTVITWSKEHDVKTIYLGTTLSFKAAHRFYEKHGFHEIAKKDMPSYCQPMDCDEKFYRIDL